MGQHFFIFPVSGSRGKFVAFSQCSHWLPSSPEPEIVIDWRLTLFQCRKFSSGKFRQEQEIYLRECIVTQGVTPIGQFYERSVFPLSTFFAPMKPGVSGNGLCEAAPGCSFRKEAAVPKWKAKWKVEWKPGGKLSCASLRRFSGGDRDRHGSGAKTRSFRQKGNREAGKTGIS